MNEKNKFFTLVIIMMLLLTTLGVTSVAAKENIENCISNDPQQLTTIERIKNSDDGYNSQDVGGGKNDFKGPYIKYQKIWWWTIPIGTYYKVWINHDTLNKLVGLSPDGIKAILNFIPPPFNYIIAGIIAAYLIIMRFTDKGNGVYFHLNQLFTLQTYIDNIKPQ